MAKFVGFIGSISGRVGTTVFCKGENGMTYGRAYQPKVADPKTVLQQDRRAIMSLVGKMTEVTPKKVLVGMGGANARQRRSAFNRILLNAATIDRSAPGAIIAKMAPEDVVFSQGAEIISASSSSLAVTASNVSLSLTLSNSDIAGRYGERIVVAVIDPSYKAGYSFVTYKDQLFDDTTAKSVTINFGQSIVDQTMVCIYRLPFVLNDDGAAMVYQSLANDSTDIVAKVVESGRSFIRGWGNSVHEASSVFTRA